MNVYVHKRRSEIQERKREKLNFKLRIEKTSVDWKLPVIFRRPKLNEKKFKLKVVSSMKSFSSLKSKIIEANHWENFSIISFHS